MLFDLCRYDFLKVYSPFEGYFLSFVTLSRTDRHPNKHQDLYKGQNLDLISDCSDNPGKMISWDLYDSGATKLHCRGGCITYDVQL